MSGERLAQAAERSWKNVVRLQRRARTVLDAEKADACDEDVAHAAEEAQHAIRRDQSGRLGHLRTKLGQISGSDEGQEPAAEKKSK